MIFLAACGKRPEAATIVTASPWPSHAPGATPYVRLQAESSTTPNSGTHQGPVEHSESYEDIIRKLYTEDGNYYGKDWEMQMFRELLQDVPYAFVVHTNAMLQGADTLEDHIALAQKFTDLGCEARVKEMRSVEEGQEHTAWVTVITTSPAHIWEISDSLGETLHIEQLYKSVDIRFDKVVWPEA
jgi:hypothetical protein